MKRLRERTRLLAFFLAALVAAPRARGADIVAYRTTGTYGAVGYEAAVVWKQGEYLLDMWSRLGAESQNLAKNRQAAETALERTLEAVFLQSVVSLPVDSRETAGSRIKASPSLLARLKSLVGSAVKRRSHMAEGMEDVRLRFAFPLYGVDGLLAIFAPSGRPAAMDRYLGFAPGAAYTGLVIYISGTYPAWGRDGAEVTLKPSLFPRIFDTDMNVVVDASRVDSSRLASWGIVAYSNDLDEAPFLERVGADPLRIVARGIYGVGDTDIIISRDASRLLLGREENLEILSEGRILVILDAESAPQPEPEAEGDEVLEELGPEKALPQGTRILAPASGR